ncbi:hypothetical protein MJH12_13970, partial [bacterium]|nr:hypothetical protein [bacterium]
MNDIPLESLKKSPYVLIFLFFICPPFALYYYLVYGGAQLRIRLLFVFSLLLAFVVSYSSLSDMVNLYHNKMLYKISKRLYRAFRY